MLALASTLARWGTFMDSGYPEPSRIYV